MSKYDKAFLTGCDSTQEWMLDWFLDNFKKHNDTPILFANFGVSSSTLSKLKRQKRFHAIMDLTKTDEKGWFNKPVSMLNCPSTKTVWLDTDCEVLSNLDGIFERLVHSKLSMVEDIPWSKRRKETWYNSGVVGFVDKPEILKRWKNEVRLNPKVGDQEVLHGMLDQLQKLMYINPLPKEYNVMRIQHMDKTVPKKPFIYHWTGRKGKIIIEKRMNGSNVFL